MQPDMRPDPEVMEIIREFLSGSVGKESGVKNEKAHRTGSK